MKLSAGPRAFAFVWFLLMLAACDSNRFDRTAAIEKTVEAQKVQIQDMQVKIAKLRDELLFQDFKKDLYKIVVFDPTHAERRA